MLARARHLLKRQKRRGISHEKISPWNSIIHIGFIRKRVFLLSSCYDKMGNGIRNYPLSLSSSLSKLVTGIIFSTDHGRQVAYNHGTRKYPAKWRGLWIIFKNFHERVSFSNSNRQYCASRLRNWPAQDGTVSRGKGAYLWPRTCSQLPVPGAWNNCIISVEAAATNPARRGRQTTPT